MDSRRDFLKNASLTSLAVGLGIPSEAAVNSGPDESIKFPKDFLFGVSTSAYQIEGGWNADGKGESIWDRWSHIPDNVKVLGDVACDHYRLYKQDIELLKRLNVNSYRFSISWTRIFPDGFGEANLKGVAFYKEILDLAKKHGVKPVVTLNHWDLPQKLQNIGGWANRELATHFSNYAKFCFSTFGNDVDFWGTHNEPWVVAFMGYFVGTHPPGIKDISTALLATHHLLLGHGMAVKAYRELNLKGKIGITLDYSYNIAETEKQEDLDAAKRLNDKHHPWFADPILLGKYPEMIWNWYKSKGIVMPEIKEGDMKIISTPIDYLGLNYYQTDKVKYNPDGWWPYETNTLKREYGKAKNFGMEPEGLYSILKDLDKRYHRIPIIITENGYNDDHDSVDFNGEVVDNKRIEYIFAHIKVCKKAIDDGVNLQGYTVWTLMDSYEWGDWSRLGLVHTDFHTLKRTIKKSGYWYAKGIENGFSLGK